MTERSEVERILAEQYGQGYVAPPLANYQADPHNERETQVTTPQVTGLLDRMYSGVPGLLRSGADRVRRDSTPDNMLAGGLDTAANWINGTPRVGEDTIAPLGLAALGMNFAVPGAAGIFGGRLARTADHEALSRAEEMAARGLPREDIWNQTGWFRGVDGHWRFEIDDSPTGRFMQSDEVYRPGRVRNEVADQTGRNLNEVTNSGYATHLANVLPHEELYRAYPDLGLARWAALPPDSLALPGYGGVWRGQTHGMEINNTLAPNLSRGRSITLHEAQHGVQDVEGFASGSNANVFAMSPEMRQNAQRQLAQITDAQLIMREAEHTGRTPAEIEFQFRHEFELNPQPGVSNWFHFNPETLAAMESRLRQRLSEAGNPGDAYRRTAGEVEARNVQARRDMTPENRRAMPPWLTQDVPDAEQILRRYNEGQP